MPRSPPHTGRQCCKRKVQCVELSHVVRGKVPLCGLSALEERSRSSALKDELFAVDIVGQ